ncbi:MAG: hypothetical protein ACOC5T_07710 [Elusimicrobiota bacterium]
MKTMITIEIGGHFFPLPTAYTNTILNVDRNLDLLNYSSYKVKRFAWLFFSVGLSRHEGYGQFKIVEED